MSRTYKAVIAEDEPLLTAELRDALAQLWPELTIAGAAANGLEALRLLDALKPDILFLDIEMPGASGLEVAKHASGRCHVVFVTAYDKYAVAAFDHGAIDYVMKPFSGARLAAAIGRAKERLASSPANLDAVLQALTQAGFGKKYVRWISASQGSDLRLITTDEICYLKSDNKYTVIFTADHEAVIRRPIREIIDELDPETFWQIHRGTLVNVNAIAGVSRDLTGRLRVRLKKRKETLPVSNPYVHRFRG